jgi:trehalose synthase-fused probable maltokinase
VDVSEWLRAVAPGRRWFADKTNHIEGVTILWRATLSFDPSVELIVARYNFTGGGSALYFVPYDHAARDEATRHSDFAMWLLTSLTLGSPVPGGLRWDRLDTTDLSQQPDLAPRTLDLEQSNTSIRYGDQVMMKLNRRLTVGPSPEAELATVIARAGDPSFAAAVHGVLYLDGIGDAPVCVAICSAFIPNVGDGWAYLLAGMADLNEANAQIDEEIAAIADVTAAMHRGLISDPWRSEVAPEPVTADDVSTWQRAALDSFDQLAQFLGERITSLPEAAGNLARLLPGSATEIRRRLGGYHALIGTHKIRIHGDYHLGQLLRRPSGGYVVVDFDGEPNRSLAERRAKYSALRDVAGMLRSLAYARGTAERAVPDEAQGAQWLAWESRARSRFLDRYRAALGDPGVPLIPASNDDMRMALAALELEKAIYECGYELGNRPDWLWLPLSRLVQAA